MLGPVNAWPDEPTPFPYNSGKGVRFRAEHTGWNLP